MKKIIMFLVGLLFVLLVVSLIIGNNKVIDDKYTYYCIPKNYAIYEDDEENFIVDVYTEEKNSIIGFNEKNNYQIRIDNNEYIINNISVTKGKDYFNSKTIYVYSFIINTNEIPIDVYKESCDLIISNDNFELALKIGVLSIYREEYEILDFVDLYGNYSYVNNELHLVGITLAFGKGYNNLTSIDSGICYGRLDKVRKDTMLNSEIDFNEIDYEIVNNRIEGNEWGLNNKNKYYFIPIGYEKLVLNLNPCFILEIDGKKYILDNFYYLYNDISLSDYPNIKKAGEVIYA